MWELTRLHRRQNRRNTRELAIEITRISSTRDLGLEWRLDPLMVDIIPIDVPEERLAHNFLSVGRSTAQSLVGLTGQQLL